MSIGFKSYAYDLHMHSCLSPCADMSMTPNNVVNMAYLKGLDIIAVSDHNSAQNLPAIAPLCKERGILLIPAIEAETREEVHVLCLLPTVDAALALSRTLNDSLLPLPFDPAFFGEQIIMDAEDNPIGTEEKLLTQATSLSIEQLFEECRGLGGVPIPAHINREANSLINLLGFIPPHLNIKSVEVYKSVPLPAGLNVDGFRVLNSSDAHNLEAILERESFAHLDELSVECVLDWARGR